MTNRLLATCPIGVEHILEKELSRLGAQALKPTRGGVFFSSEPDHLLALIVSLRSANSVNQLLAEGQIRSPQEFQRLCATVDWADVFQKQPIHFQTDITLRADTGVKTGLKHSLYVSQLVKDAIQQQLGAAAPRFERHQGPLIKGLLLGTKAMLFVNIGGPLHRRGYRQVTTTAPLRENLAAAFLLSLNDTLPFSEIANVIDPLCGSGTLLFEAMMLALDFPPGLLHLQEAWQFWPHFQQDQFWQMQHQAIERCRHHPAQSMRFLGCDRDESAIQAARKNATRLGDWPMPLLAFTQDDAFRWLPTQPREGTLILANLPYGERLEDPQSLIPFYHQFSQTLGQQHEGCPFGLFVPDSDLSHGLTLKVKQKNKWRNGPIDCLFLQGIIPPLSNQASNLPQGALELTNRLKKNIKHLKKSLPQDEPAAVRVYDADMPEYNAAIDRYGDTWIVQEYQAPKDIDEQDVSRRRRWIVLALTQGLGISHDRIILKTRGIKEQYEGQFEDASLLVKEGPCTFTIHPKGKIDCGLFLDHRPLRAWMHALAKGQRLLNLFAYSCTATVSAALGGARASDSVDWNRGHLEMARENLRLNHLDETRHRLHRDDCLSFIQRTKNTYDLILFDPPTYSKRGKTGGGFNLQQDYLFYLKRLKPLLAQDGILLFSGNFQQFQRDEAAIQEKGFNLLDLTPDSIPEDFRRRPRIHFLLLLWHQDSSLPAWAVDRLPLLQKKERLPARSPADLNHRENESEKTRPFQEGIP